MKLNSKSRPTRLVLFIICIIAIGLISWLMFQSKGPHNGEIKKAESFYIEMKNENKDFHAWLYDDKFNAIKNNLVTGEVRFYLPDSSDFSVGLKSMVPGEFMCESIPGFYACKISFNVAGKPIEAFFENQSQVAKDLK